MKLVIVESPAKCKKIASFLGAGWQVIASMGHIRALEEDIDAIGIDRDFEPKFRFIKEKSKATAQILAAAKGADEIYLAADDDREGEAIAYSVACLLKKNPESLPRAVFHEITEKAVRNAVANPRRIDMNRVNAQQARAVLDMLVGFTISPLLWKHVARALSAGRCQTPALRLVSDREKEIRGHTAETTWGLSGDFQAKMDDLGSKGAGACNISFTAKMDDELEDQESALNYLENIYGDSHATVASADNRPWTANPPKPLITSSLQQEASALHKINPKATMRSAQSLYEAGHITYMRTDHAILSEEAILSAQAEVKKQYGDEYVGSAAAARAPPAAPKKKVKTDTTDAAQGAKSSGSPPVPQAQEAHDTSRKGAKSAGSPPVVQQQEAHEAIRPTHFDLKELPLTDDWSPQDKKVYTLIYRRAMQSVMSPAKGQTRTVKIHHDADTDKFPWTATWRKTDFAGWQILGQAVNLDDDSEEEEKDDINTWKKAQQIVTGTKITWCSLQAAPKRSRASPRYNEATLIRELEKRGIGRPSTFASLVEVLFEKTYVEKQDISGSKINNITLTIKPNQWPPLTQVTQIALGAEKQKLVPTALGESVLSFCLKEFPQLFAYEFTAQMEGRLDKVAKGEEFWKQLCRDTWVSYKNDYERLKSKESLPSSSEKVKDFGDGFKAVMSKTGPLLLQEATDADPKKSKATFYAFPPNVTIQDITKEQAREWIESLSKDTMMGTWEGKTIEKKKGPYGMYMQCGEIRIPFIESDTQEQILEKFRSRASASSNNYKFGPYTFGKGQYGPYMYKHDLKTRIFVGIPDSIDPKSLSAEEADALYKNGVEAKKAKGSFRGGRGGRGGRGAGRGGH